MQLFLDLDMLSDTLGEGTFIHDSMGFMLFHKLSDNWWTSLVFVKAVARRVGVFCMIEKILLEETNTSGKVQMKLLLAFKIPLLVMINEQLTIDKNRTIINPNGGI